MTQYDVKRLALVLAIQAEIEGMKANNSQHEQDQPYEETDFEMKAHELTSLAYKHDEEM